MRRDLLAFLESIGLWGAAKRGRSRRRAKLSLKNI